MEESKGVDDLADTCDALADSLGKVLKNMEADKHD